MKSLDRPELLDLLVQPTSEDVNMEEVEDLRPSKRKIIYTEVCIEFAYFCSFKDLVSHKDDDIMIWALGLINFLLSVLFSA